MTDRTDPADSTLKAAFLRHEETLAPPGHALGEDDSAVYRTLLESTKAIGVTSDALASLTERATKTQSENPRNLCAKNLLDPSVRDGPSLVARCDLET